MAKNEKPSYYEELLELNDKIIQDLVHSLAVAKESEVQSSLLKSAGSPFLNQPNLNLNELVHVSQALKSEVQNQLHCKKSILDLITDGLIICEINGKIIDLNRSLLDFLGKEKREILNTEFTDFLNINGFDFNDILKIKGRLTREGLLNLSGGKELNCSVTISLFNEGTNSPKVVFLIRDISDLKEMENIIAQERERAINSARLAALGQMAGNIAHEINNPLTVITTSLSLLKKASDKGALDSEVVNNIANDIHNTILRITRIVNGLRTVSRESNRFEKEMSPSKEIFEDIIGLCSEKCMNSGVKLETNIDADDFPLEIYCDRLKLSQVLLNLINNAYDAICELDQKWILIKLTEQEGNYLISITDSGSGLPEELKENLFEPFFTTKGIGKGTGLGLSISQSIIEEHGGKLTIDETCSNTCFNIILPKKILETQREAI